RRGGGDRGGSDPQRRRGTARPTADPLPGPRAVAADDAAAARAPPLRPAARDWADDLRARHRSLGASRTRARSRQPGRVAGDRARLTHSVPAPSAWALPALGLAVGNLAGSLAIGLGFAAGRALPVLVLAVRGEETMLAERPEGLRALRVLIAASLVLALIAGEARGAAEDASP